MRVGHGWMVACGLVLSAPRALAQPAPAPPPASQPNHPTVAFPDAADEPPKNAAKPAPPGASPVPTPAPTVTPPPDLPKPAPPASGMPAPASSPPNASAAPDRAGKAAPKTPPARTYDWNLGAGIGFGDDGTLRGAGIFSGVATSTPSFRVALERRIAGGLWLMLNGSFLFSTAEGPPADADAGPENVTRTIYSAGGVAGVRQAMTSGIVETSVTLGFGLGYLKIGGDDEELDTFSFSGGAGSSAITYGFVGGLSVERELIEALALRLSANVVSLAWTDATVVPTTDGLPKEHTESTTFAVDLVPVIDLRFYF